MPAGSQQVLVAASEVELGDGSFGTSEEGSDLRHMGGLGLLPAPVRGMTQRAHQYFRRGTQLAKEMVVVRGQEGMAICCHVPLV